jgi:hypothetical protein
MRVLVGCEESQAVTIAFREKGHEAYSCDILPCSGGHPEWHIKDSIHHVLCKSFCLTENKDLVATMFWDLIIAHPPCTFLTVSNTYITRGCSKYTKEEALEEREMAKSFFMSLVNANCEKICIENPIGIMSKFYRKPDQIIQPWMFGHAESKSTCLWLKGLPLLEPTKIAEFKKYRCKCGYVFDESLGKYGCANCGGQYIAKPLWDNMTPSGQNKLGPSSERSKLRSKTYSGIAKAMSDQWG